MGLGANTKSISPFRRRLLAINVECYVYADYLAHSAFPPCLYSRVRLYSIFASMAASRSMP